MITSEDLTNRRVTGAVAATVSGIKPGTIRKLQHDKELPAAPLSIADSMSIALAAKLHALGLSLPKAAGIGRSITESDWRRVVLESDPVKLHLIAGVGADGVLQVAVADDAELAALPDRPGICVDLTAVARDVFERLVRLRRGEAP